MARGKAHPPELKAMVLASLAAGTSPAEVARQFELDLSIISRWGKQIPQVLQAVATQKNRDFGNMLGSYLEELIKTAVEQQKHFRDKEWLQRQNAADIAVLHGVSIDKGIRLFEAANRAQEAES
jgi:transposase-like protein